MHAAIPRFAAARRGGLFLDFDGTIADIQDDPETVAANPGVLAEIGRAAGLVERVAIISGRNVEFLRKRFSGIGRVELFGMYGLERADQSGEVVLHPDVRPWLPVVRSLRERAGRELPGDVYVEDKQLAVALHYRRAPHNQAIIESWSAERAAETGIAVQGGRMVVELKPPVDRNKGHVVVESTRHLDAAWYFGDDVGDVEAFAAMAERRRADPGFAGLNIAVVNDTRVGELAEHADIVLSSPAAVATALSELNEALARG